MVIKVVFEVVRFWGFLVSCDWLILMAWDSVCPTLAKIFLKHIHVFEQQSGKGYWQVLYQTTNASYHMMMPLFSGVVKQGTCNFVVDPFPAIAGGISLHLLQGREDGVIVSHIYCPSVRKAGVCPWSFRFYSAAFLVWGQTSYFSDKFVHSESK